MNKYIDAVLELNETEQIATLKKLSFKRISTLPETCRKDFENLWDILLQYEQAPDNKDPTDSWLAEIQKRALENNTCAYCGSKKDSELDHHCSYLCKAEWEEMYEGLKAAYSL